MISIEVRCIYEMIYSIVNVTPLSRRQVLGAAAVVVGGGSGCTGMGAQETPTTSPTVTSTEPTYSHCTRNLTTRQAYHSTGKPVIRSTEFIPATDWTSTEWVVASPSDRDALNYSSEATDIDVVRGYIHDTDLSARSILIHQYNFDECTDLQVERVMWEEVMDSSSGRFDLAVEFADINSDENCKKGTITTVMRIPAAIEEVATLKWATSSIGGSNC